MQIIESLQKEDNIQLILTTHSPNLGSKVKLENLILCTNNYAFPLGKDYTELEDENYKFLERFLDTTKANLFFAKGVIFVEGWAEEILLPAIAKKLKSQNIISKNLTEAGVSIINIGNTAFRQYSRIYLRKREPLLYIPVAIVTDVDIRAYEKKARKDEAGNIIKTAEGKVEYEYIKRDNETVMAESQTKKANIVSDWEIQNIKVYVAPHWTLEYSLFKSFSLSQKFKEIFKSIHPQIDEGNYEVELAKKLINKGLKKTEIAYQLAQKIETDADIEIDPNDNGINYLIDAIKYVCNN
jgi:putative ATP-dependent endonuclease of OLD family